jgi:hypothetical protein
MRDCWQWEASRRPTFQQIHYEMENMFQVATNYRVDSWYL